jgi:hypothetical protein
VTLNEKNAIKFQNLTKTPLGEGAHKIIDRTNWTSSQSPGDATAASPPKACAAAASGYSGGTPPADIRDNVLGAKSRACASRPVGPRLRFGYHLFQSFGLNECIRAAELLGVCPLRSDRFAGVEEHGNANQSGE